MNIKQVRKNHNGEWGKKMGNIFTQAHCVKLLVVSKPIKILVFTFSAQFYDIKIT